ncbi:MAG: ABC transporter permease/substrate-binding protein [Bifidobacteriaceae bacterium]|jgi:osmoprotectant transport system permease protein|nr:ABC transporter permease/substrate-binding protein [Bifidobacteriaceae bacterium]MCI1978471.1 ABC transporter permease/substrate-binding protein [Bifidobacteriaceae bacterium]
MSELGSYIAQNWQGILVALWNHLEISALAIFVTLIIAIPLAVVMMNHRRAGEIVLQVASMIQTIPSLAILGILIPFVGIGTVPAVIALVLYAIMPVFQNAYTGLTTLDPVLMEAAEALGLPRRLKLFRIQMPMALPMIMSGVRIAVVMIIGTATLAALIGGGGLGTYILLGIQTNNNAALVVGAVLSAALALAASGLIRRASKLPLKKLGIGMVVFALIVGGTSLGNRVISGVASEKKETVVIAGKMGGEPEILINMYKDLIEASDPTVSVQLSPNFGGTSFLFSALKSAKIDIYPEFTGTVLQSLVKTGGTVNHDPKVAYAQAKKALKQEFGMEYLSPMKYENTYAIAVRKADAQKYGLKNIGDLTVVSGQLSAGFDPDFYQQSDGYPGLVKKYGLAFSDVKTMEPALRYKAMANGRIDVSDAYTTDPQIKQYDLTLLADSDSFFPPYQGAPLMTSDFAAKHPRIVSALNKLAGKINDDEMQSMNYRVTVRHEGSAVVAKDYLQKQNLL